MPKRLTYSNVTASIALFVALGGTSYAVTQLPRNSVGSTQVRDGSLQRKDLARGMSRGPRGVEGPQGPVGATGGQGPRGPSSVRIARQAQGVNLSGVQGQPTQVRRMDAVPAGSWLLRFEGSPHLAVATGLHVVCVIKVNGDPVADVATVVGTNANAAQEASFSVDAAVQQAAPFNVTVDCHQTLSTSPPAFVLRAQIIATQVGDVVATP
jgi:hypothetical protein